MVKQFKYIHSIFLFCSCFSTNGQNFVWAKDIGGPLYDQSNSITVDKYGSVYVIGFFQDTADFDPGPGTYTMAAKRHDQTFITKLDSSGNFIWAKQLGGINHVLGNYSPSSIVADSAGDIYVTSCFDSLVDMDPGNGVFPLTGFGQWCDIFVAKLSGQGNLIWAKQIGSQSWDWSSSITIDASGNVYTTGFFMGLADFDPGPLTYTIFSQAGVTCFISKLDNSGNFVFAKSLQIGGSEGHTIKIDLSGNIYISGFYSGTVDFDPGPGTYLLNATGATDIFVCKLNSLGNFLWAKSMGSSLNEYCWSMAVDQSGNVYTTGEFAGSADMDPGPGTAILTSAGAKDIFVSKLDNSGNYSWCKRFGSSGDEKTLCITTDISGNVYFTGQFCCVPVDFDPGAGTFTLGVDSGTAFLEKLDSNGDFIWIKQFGGNTIGSCIALSQEGNIYITGNVFYQTLPADFNPGSGLYLLNGFGWMDAFVTRLSPSCFPPSQPFIVNSNNLSICKGDSAVLQGFSSGALNWYSSGTSLTPITSGNIFTTQTLSEGTYTYFLEAVSCTVNPNRTQVTVTVNPLPLVSAQAIPPSVCFGENITLIASGAQYFLWSFSSSNSTLVVTPAASSVYSLTGTDLKGCQMTVSVNINVSSCTSLPEETVSDLRPNVFPNPTKDLLLIQSIEKTILKRILITDAIGRIVVEEPNISNQINVNNLMPGIYYVQFIYADKNYYTKFLKE